MGELRRIVRYRTPGAPTILHVGDYVEPATEPAGVGWCEAIPLVPGDRHCLTYARTTRDGRRVCGLHARAGEVTFRSRVAPTGIEPASAD